MQRSACTSSCIADVHVLSYPSRAKSQCHIHRACTLANRRCRRSHRASIEKASIDDGIQQTKRKHKTKTRKVNSADEMMSYEYVDVGISAANAFHAIVGNCTWQ